MTLFIVLVELIGTVAFAVSGAMIGIKKGMDILGVCVLGLTTACGGGVIRDIMLGSLPPVMFREPVYALTAIVVSVMMFLPIVRKLLLKKQRAYDVILLLADSAGLGVFSVYGVAAAFNAGYGENLFFAVFLGTVTGVGGGVLRDIMAGMPPYIFVKHIYCCAAIAGALICARLWPYTGGAAAKLIGAVVIIVIRLLAAHYHWSLPRAHGEAVEPAQLPR